MQNFSIDGGNNSEGMQIENLLKTMKKRVLKGETMANFKREIA